MRSEGQNVKEAAYIAIGIDADGRSLLKMLYLAMIDITAKWTGRPQDWAGIHVQLTIFYVDRLPD